MNNFLLRKLKCTETKIAICTYFFYSSLLCFLYKTIDVFKPAIIFSKSNIMWSDLDFYHGILAKLEDMIEKGKFNSYVLPYDKQLLRGHESLNEYVTLIKKTKQSTNKRHEYIFRLFLASNTNISEDYTLIIENIEKHVVNDTDARVTRPMISVNLFFTYIRHEFNFKELQAQGIELDTVLNVHFEKAFMKVPCCFLEYSHGSHVQRYLLGIEQDIFQQRYLEILQYIQKTLAIAMSQHDCLGNEPTRTPWRKFIAAAYVP